MKPDLLLRADEPYGPPNPGMSCVETPVSKKHLDMDSVHKLSPRPPPPSFLPLSNFRGKKKTRRSPRWPPANQLNPIYDYMLLSSSWPLQPGLAC